MQEKDSLLCPSPRDRNLRDAGIGYLCTGIAFLGVAFLAHQEAFTGAGFAFLGLGIAFIARKRPDDDPR